MTLLELTLVLALVAALATMMAVSFGPGHSRGRFEEAVDKYDTLMRMARVEAANQGRRFLVSFNRDKENYLAASARVMWEPDPLGEPGEFKEFTKSAWVSFIPASDDIRVVSCQLTGASAYRLVDTRGENDDEDSLSDLMFYPDGTSDAALIELAPTDESDSMRAVIRIDALSGAIETIMVGAAELEEHRQDIEDGLYVPFDGSDSYDE